jgi:formate dehydrogenase iron-sulfur subunit
MLWLEPLVEVEVNGQRLAYGPVAPEDVPNLFAAGFLEGKAHPLFQGPTEAIPYLRNQTRVTFARIGVTDPLSIADYESHGGFVGLRRALQMTANDIAEVVQHVLDSGLRGRGGAGLSTGGKWQSVRRNSAPQKYVIANAEEGDSGTFADRMVMEGDPYMLIEGMIIAAITVGATQGYVYINADYTNAIAIMNQAVKRARAAGYLGHGLLGSEHDFDLEIRRGAGSYVCGEKGAMLESIEGKRGIVRNKLPPIEKIGLFGQPTVVNNVLTLAAVPFILAEGGQAYADLGMDRSRGTLPFQLAGNIRFGGLVELPFGITLRQLIMDFGGGTATGRPFKTVQVGGPLGSYLPESLLDTPMDYEALTAQGAALGHGGIVVFDDTVDMAEQAYQAMHFCVLESCGKCTPCRIGSVRGRELIAELQQHPETAPYQIGLLREVCETMEDASLCAMGSMTPFPVLSAIDHFPEDFHLDKPTGESA